jgi:hypothetical protein
MLALKTSIAIAKVVLSVGLSISGLTNPLGVLNASA